MKMLIFSILILCAVGFSRSITTEDILLFPIAMKDCANKLNLDVNQTFRTEFDCNKKVPKKLDQWSICYAGESLDGKYWMLDDGSIDYEYLYPLLTADRYENVVVCDAYAAFLPATRKARAIPFLNCYMRVTGCVEYIRKESDKYLEN